MEGTDNKTIVVTITPEMHAALLELAPQHGATVAGLTRALLAKWLEEQGRPVNWVIPWGGRRRKDASPSDAPDAYPPPRGHDIDA